jgi:tRNA dimethylallyltransferase
MPKSITVIGPTASGKTKLAVALAGKLDGEIISIDSRQFYRKMDIGTGKDLEDFGTIPYHLIDITDAGNKLNVSDFKYHFYNAFHNINSRNKTPILCGGTGNYLLSVLQNTPYTEISSNPILRKKLELLSHEELIEIIKNKNIPHDYQPDTSTNKRCIRSIEILTFLETNSLPRTSYQPIETTIIGINPNQEERRKNISLRLKNRLENGLIEEVTELRKTLSDDDLIYYGLEYKYLTLYLNSTLSKDKAISKLETEIHRYAKRQMTFFRKIGKDGFKIHWIDKPDLELALRELI